MIVCVDTHVLIWGIREEAGAGQERMIARTKHLLGELERAKARIIVPAPVVMEALIGLDSARHQAFLGRLGRQFVIGPFDARAAAEAASIWLSINRGRQLSDEIRFAAKGTRSEIKCDIMLLAIAISRGASVLYTEDADLTRLANRVARTRVEAIPEAKTQLRFDELINTDAK